MATKNDIIKSIIETLKNSFVVEYDKINRSRELVNEYIKEIDFNYEYDYNTFCVEFLNTTQKVLESISEEDMNKMDINILIYESFSLMVRNKIFNSTTSESEKQKLMILHELKKYLIKKGD